MEAAGWLSTVVWLGGVVDTPRGLEDCLWGEMGADGCEVDNGAEGLVSTVAEDDCDESPPEKRSIIGLIV